MNKLVFGVAVLATLAAALFFHRTAEPELPPHPCDKFQNDNERHGKCIGDMIRWIDQRYQKEALPHETLDEFALRLRRNGWK